jgi:hypothetical protein
VRWQSALKSSAWLSIDTFSRTKVLVLLRFPRNLGSIPGYRSFLNLGRNHQTATLTISAVSNREGFRLSTVGRCLWEAVHPLTRTAGSIILHF